MRKTTLVLAVIFYLSLGVEGWRDHHNRSTVLAQAFPSSAVSSNTGTTSQCPAIAAGQGGWCIAGGIVYISQNGGAWTAIPTAAGSSGVTSWNGLTGTVTYTAPVTSVNTKTGAVVLGATTTIQ